MIIDVLRIGVLLLVTFAYAMFDVFNKREVPDLFVYVTVLAGLIVLITYNTASIITGLLLSAIIGAFGYLLFREGWLGAGDFLEFVFIALILPVQMQPLLVNIQQLGLPFIFSVFIGAGYSVSIFVPLYYLIFVKKSGDEKGRASKRPNLLGYVLLVLYLILLFIVNYFFYYNLKGIVLILLLAIPATLTLAYEKTIYYRMVSFIYPKDLEEGDMIAETLMDKKDLAYYRKKTNLFGRLATGRLIKAIRNEKRKMPVYRNSVPFALFVFIGVVLSLLFGNILLLILF